MPRDKKFRMVVLLLVDICVIQFSSFMGLWMRFDMRLQSIPENYRMAAVKYAIPYTLITLVIFYVFRMYSSMWSVAGVREACHIVFACVLTSLCQIAGMTMLQLNVPRSYFAISFIILTGCEGLVRRGERKQDSDRGGRNFRIDYPEGDRDQPVCPWKSRLLCG